MNKWKIAFWACFTLMMVLIVISAYSIIDQAYTITYHKVSYQDTENDLDQLMEVINTTDLSKLQIEIQLKDHPHFEFMNFNSDTVSLHRIQLIFANEKLIKITKQW